MIESVWGQIEPTSEFRVTLKRDGDYELRIDELQLYAAPADLMRLVNEIRASIARDPELVESLDVARMTAEAQVTVDHGHDYPGCRVPEDFFTSDCAYGCGCWMGDSRSGGPDGVNPFGLCPKNPNNAAKLALKNAMNRSGLTPEEFATAYNNWIPEPTC